MSDLDVVVLGAGSGGMSAAKKASREGANVTVIENRTVGGTCVARGCMPKKFMVISAELMRDLNADGPDGLERSVDHMDWGELIDHQQAVVRDLIDISRDGLQDYDNIKLVEGTGIIKQPGTVTVGNRDIGYDRLIIATGLRPSRPPITGVEHGQTSDEFLQDRTRPDSVTIVGGGYIGVEFGAVLNAFGTDVTIVHRPERLIKNYDFEVADRLKEQLVGRGIEVHTSSEVQSIEPLSNGYEVTYEGDQTGAVQSDQVMLAVGRSPNTDNIGLEHLDVDTDQAGYIEVGTDYRTEDDNVFAVGDVIGEFEFTPVAIREGKTAAQNALTGSAETINRTALPTAVFTSPPIGSAGLTEQQAKTTHDDVQVATKSFTPFSVTVRRESGETFIKLVYSSETLVGIHVMGPHAPELVQGFGVAIRNGVTMEELKDYPGIHPTVTEEVFSTQP